MKGSRPSVSETGAKALDFVEVDNRHQIVEPVMGRKKDRFPVRAFVAFAIAHENHNAMVGTGDLGRLGHAGRYRQAMPQRAGREFDARNAFMRNMATQV